MKEIVVALAGNPNAGKTTVFNALTGSRQHVGNYPGVTVEKKEGTVKRGDVLFKVVDLPGTYSLSASSPEEVVARDFLVNSRPDVVVQVLDAFNLDRNLYLAVQLMELGVKMVFALNMADVAKARGIEFDIAKLKSLIKAPVVPTIGNRKEGIDDLLTAVARAAESPDSSYEKIHYPAPIAEEINKLDSMLTGEDKALAKTYPEKWLAARLIENDADITNRVKSSTILSEARTFRETFSTENDDLPEIAMAEARYGWISGLTAESVKFTPEARMDMSDKIDSVLLNRVLGLPIFLLLLYGVFQLLFSLAVALMEWFEQGFGALGESVAHMWPKAADSPLRDLIVDGIIGGVGGVLVFLPNIILLFLAIAFLEGTGYMARAAFLMDRFMNQIGLHGKSFIPMLLGFGCTVPAIMGTRTLENRRDRITTILVLPWMSCGARLPIYALIIPAFFPEALHAWMLWIIYIIGIVFAIVGAKVLRSTLFKGVSVPFVMELPPYRMPTLRSVITLMWDRAREYVKKAGTIILAVSIILWAMTAYPKKENFDQDYGAQHESLDTQLHTNLTAFASENGLDADLLLAWRGALEDMQAASDQFWEHEEGYAMAEAAYEEKVEELFAQPGGERLRQFIAAEETVGEIDSTFEEAVAEEEEGSDSFVAAEQEKAATIANLDYPAEIVSAAVQYRDELILPYTEESVEVDNAMQSEELAYSISGRIGLFLEPILKPVGFDWRIGTAIIGSFAAKEVFVAQMGIVYSVGEADEESDSLRSKLQANYTPLQGFCMMLFALLSLPCVATIAVAKRETGGWGFPIAMIIGFTVIAYVATLIVYQLGMAFGIGV